MQRTIRVLRVALPIVFLAFVGLLVAKWNGAVGREARPPGEGVTSTRENDEPVALGLAFRDVQTIGGRVVSEIVAAKVVSFASGWTTLEGVTLTLYRANGLKYVISCPAAEFNSKTKEAKASGGVRVTSSDGIDIRTAQIRYDGARLTNDVAVDFKIDRWTGKAGALDLDVAGETLRLYKNVDATMVPLQPTELPMTLGGAESIFRRAQNVVEFTQQVRMTRGPESLRADFMTGRFTPDRKQIVGLDGRGNVSIVTAANPAPGEDLGGRKEITCDVFTTELGPDGQINAINAIAAENIARANLEGAPRREILARTFRIALANRAVSEIKADWQVVMKEIGQETRQINAEHVTVWFDAVTRRARTAYLEGAFRYADPKTTASAFRATYDIAADRIVLTTDPGWQATVTSDGQVLKAKQIEFAPRAQTARASGSVIAQLVGKGKGTGASADGTNLFPSGKPVFVNSDELLMRQQQKSAHFSGNVRAWQENNTLLSQELVVQGAGETLTARGNVRTMLYNTAASAARKTPMQTTSEQLVARRNERRIELVGNVSIVDETRSLKSENATLFLDQQRKVERMEAEKSVQIAEGTTGRRGTGEKAVYEVEKKMIYVFGKPATISDPKGDVAGQQIVFDIAKDRVQVLSSEGKTKGTYKHEG